MALVVLNIYKSENYCLMDLKSKLFLSLGRPVCEVKELTPTIENCIRTGRLVDVENKFKIEISEHSVYSAIKTLQTLEFKKETIDAYAKGVNNYDEPSVDEPQEDTDEDLGSDSEDGSEEEVVEAIKEAPKKRGGKGKASTKKGDEK